MTIGNKSVLRWSACGLIILAWAFSTAVAQLPETVDLFAGQDILVGEVLVFEDNGNLAVTYTITDPDWCIQHVHTAVGAEESDIPQNRKGNPTPGQFEVNEPVDCASTHTVDLGPLPAGDFVVAAHAEVDTTPACQAEGLLFGTQQDTGYIWEIDVVGCTANMLIDTGDPAPADSNPNSPNGLAYDAAGNTLYFSVSGDVSGQPEGPGSALYSADLNSMTVSGPLAINPGPDLTGHSAGGTFFMGSYWYVANNSDQLYEVAVGGLTETFSCDIDGAGTGLFRFGDSAVAPGTSILFASTNGPESTFFSVDINGCTDFTRLCEDPGNSASGVGECADQQQLSYGSNGILYGHSTGGGQFFEVDTATGLNSVLACDLGLFFTDLASGLQCTPDEETAWGDGDQFVDRGNWATFIFVDQTP